MGSSPSLVTLRSCDLLMEHGRWAVGRFSARERATSRYRIATNAGRRRLGISAPLPAQKGTVGWVRREASTDAKAGVGRL